MSQFLYLQNGIDDRNQLTGLLGEWNELSYCIRQGKSSDATTKRTPDSVAYGAQSRVSLSCNSLPWAVQAGRTELFQHFPLGILLLLILLLCYSLGIVFSDRLRLGRRHIYILLLEQATCHFGSHFTGKTVLIWPHPREAGKYSLQLDIPIPALCWTCIGVFPLRLAWWSSVCIMHHFYCDISHSGSTYNLWSCHTLVIYHRLWYTAASAFWPRRLFSSS